MDLSTVAVEQFKAQFPRSFPYLPVYDDEKLYNKDAQVYYGVTELFYQCLVNGTIGVAPDFVPTPPATSPWQQYVDDIYNYVLDADIERAFVEARQVFNQSLINGDDDFVLMAFLYLTAHFLVNDLRAAEGGVSAGVAGNVSSRSVGNVSESYAFPDAWSKSPILQFYTTSPYGLKYLNMVLPKMVGNVNAIRGTTRP